MGQAWLIAQITEGMGVREIQEHKELGDST